MAAKARQVTINVKKEGNALLGLVQFGEGSFCLTNPSFAIDTNFDIQNTPAFDFIFEGKIITAAAGLTWDTGSSQDTTIDLFVAALLSIDEDGSTTHLDYGAEAATAALAVENLDVVTPTGDVVCGHVVIETDDGVNWEAGTDALTGGSGGSVADSTVYTSVMGWVK